jgi:transcription initiation factor TFIIIB Brf1 subunit/transcription initiation factor TFIIB
MAIRITKSKWGELVKYYSEKLNLSEPIQNKSTKMISKLHNAGIYLSKGRFSGIMYIYALLGNERKSQRVFAEAFDIHEATLRKSYKWILDNNKFPEARA